MTFKEFIKDITPYTFLYIQFEGDTFIYDKNYAEKFNFDHRYDDCEVIEHRGAGELDHHLTLRKPFN